MDKCAFCGLPESHWKHAMTHPTARRQPETHYFNGVVGTANAPEKTYYFGASLFKDAAIVLVVVVVLIGIMQLIEAVGR